MLREETHGGARRALSLLPLATALLSACGGTVPGDLLAQINARGTLVAGMDPITLKPDGQRAATTRCTAAQRTVGELQGFDPDVAAAIADRLGVEPCFVVADSFARLTAGHWGGAWDVSVASMTITTSRQLVLTFTEPYYYTTAQFAAAAGSGIVRLADLNGKAICTGAGTTYEFFLRGDFARLGLPPSHIYAQPPTDTQLVPIANYDACGPALAAGGAAFHAYLTAGFVVIQDLRAGLPIVTVGDPVFSEDLAVSLDKFGAANSSTLLARLNENIAALHTDGTLRQLSLQWFGVDLTVPPVPAG